MKIGHFSSFYGLIFALVICTGTVCACNLPLDPKVCVIPDGAEETGAVVDENQCRVGIKSDEGEEVKFKTYIDITGRENGLVPTIDDWHGRKLIDLEKMELSAVLKLKFGELISRNGFNLSDPEAIGLGGSIRGFTITGVVKGGSFFAENFENRTCDDMNQVLPNEKSGDWERSLGNDERMIVTKGKYSQDGSFGLKSIAARFTWDSQGIGGCSGSSDKYGNISATFNVPTFPHFYESIGYVDMTFDVSGVKWNWTEEHQKFNATDSEWERIGNAKDCSMQISGTITRTSDGADGTGGHPGFFFVQVEDKSPCVYSNLISLPTGLTTTTGETLSAFDVQFELVDNNPFPKETSIPIDFYYTVAVTDYQNGNFPATGKLMDTLKFPEYKDKFVWKKGSTTATRTGVKAYAGGVDPDSVPALQVAGIGGSEKAVKGPLTHSVTTWRANLAFTERMGYHFCKDSQECEGNNGGKLFGWESGKRLKYFIVPKGDGSGNPGMDFTEPALNTSAQTAEEDGYAKIQGTFPGVSKGTPPEPFENTVTGPKTDKCIGNLGSWEVTDNDPPNVFLAIKDTRFNQTHVFGDNTRTLDSGTDPFKNFSTTSDNGHLRQESIPEFVFTGGDSDDESGYDNFRTTYTDPNSFHNFPDDPNGMWVDEDTKLELFAWGYDNINTYDGSHGLSEGAGSGGGEVCWWGQNKDYGSFKVIDAPGNVNAKWFPNYIFRYPNRPKSLAAGDCSMEVSCSDGRGGSRRVSVNVYVIWNKKSIRGLEERKMRQQ